MRKITTRLMLLAIPIAGLTASAPPAAAVCNTTTYELGLGCNPGCAVTNSVLVRLGQQPLDCFA